MFTFLFVGILTIPVSFFITGFSLWIISLVEDISIEDSDAQRTSFRNVFWVCMCPYLNLVGATFMLILSTIGVLSELEVDKFFAWFMHTVFRVPYKESK